jgi:ribosomal protein S18 acetylase RimI-like enzyme
MSVTTIDRIDHTSATDTDRLSGPIADIVTAINHEGSNKALPPRMSAQDVAALVRRLGERGGVFYCKDDGQVVAFATVQPDDSEPGTAIMGVWVLASHRRRGIGTELARMGVEFARDAGYTKLRGTIPVSNDPALSFFSAVGPIVQLEAGGMGYELPV